MTWISAVRVLDPHPWNTLVEIEADDGTVGIGLTQSAPAHIRPIIEDGPGALRTHLIGRDPLDVAGLWRGMWEGWPGQYGRGSEGGLAANAIGALDIALWDLAGKLQGKPVWRAAGRQGPGPGDGLRKRLDVRVQLVRGRRPGTVGAEVARAPPGRGRGRGREGLPCAEVRLGDAFEPEDATACTRSARAPGRRRG